MNRFNIFSSIIIVAFFLFSIETLNAQNLNPTFNPGISGFYGQIIKAARRADGKMVFSGNFEVINGKRQTLIAVVNEDGTIDETFNPPVIINQTPQSTTYVGEIVPQPDGKLIIIGNFTHIGGVAIENFARLNVDGSLDTTFNIGTGANGTVYNAKLLSDGKIFVCGSFTTFNNQPYGRLIRLNSDGSIDQTFSLSLQYAVSFQDMILQPDGKIIVIGDIFSETTGDFQAIARINANGTRDTSFNPGSSTNLDYITSMALQPDGKILISGSFETYNGVTRRGMARINSNGSLDTTFDARASDGGATRTVTFMLQNNGQIIIGGGFKQVNGVSQPYLARLNTNGTLDGSFAPAFDQGISSGTYVSPVFLLPDQKILVSGTFVAINQSPYLGFAKINTDGTPDASFRLHAKIVGTIIALAIQNDGKMIIGGSFSSVNGIFNYGVARLNTDGSVDTGFNTGKGTLKTTIGVAGSPNGYITAIAIQNDGKIILGGDFGTFNDVHMNSLVRLNPDGSNDPTYLRSTLGGTANSIKILPDNKILVSGSYGIRRLNSDGTVDSGFDPGILDNQVRDFVIQPDGKIIIGGFFTNISGVSKNRIARLNANGSLDTSFTTGADSYINSIVQKNDGKIVIAGNFISINGNSRVRIAQLNSDGSLDTTFNAGAGSSSVIYKILVQEDGKILVAGGFNAFANLNRKKLVRLFPDGSLDSNFAANFEPTSTDTSSSSIYALAQNGKKITFGGNFSKINNYKLSSIAQLQTSKTLFDYDGDGKTDIGIYRPSTGAWWIAQSGNNQVYAVGFGSSTDKIVPADFTGDGKTDMALFRESSGEWFILRSDNNTFYGFPFGSSGDKAVPADFDGDGKADPTVYRSSNQGWYSILSSNGSVSSRVFGLSEDVPLPNDYDGDGKADLGIFRPSTSAWWIQRSSNNSIYAAQFGATGDKPTPADFTGDGKTDFAFYRPSNSTWYVLRSEDSSFYGFPFGASTDTPVVGDYDGDNKADAAVFRPSDNGWYLLRSTAGFTAVTFGTSGDKPVPSSYLP